MLVELNHVSRSFEGNQRRVLDDLSFNITAGSTVAVTGPSGSGKSTLLNLIGILDFPVSGEVLIDGKATHSLAPKDQVEIRNNRIGFVFQSHLLLPQLSVMENILLPVLPQEKTRRDKAPGKAKNLLKEVGLADRADSYPSEMSVGECQRVAVVRALINDPELILADEPTGSLDFDTAEKLGDMLLELRKNHKFSLVVVTHSSDLARRMEIHYKLVNGKLLSDEPAQP